MAGLMSESGSADFEVSDDVITVLKAQLPTVAENTMAAVKNEVPAYAELEAVGRGRLQLAVELALKEFLEIAVGRGASDLGAPMEPAVEAAYALGGVEARSGRSMDALLAAYRVGARVAWREMAASAVAQGVTAQTLVSFAELVFAYIDALSAASVAGHSDQLTTSGRVRQRHLERLGHSLLVGAADDALVAAAQRADWDPPERLIAVILPQDRVRDVLLALDPRTLQPVEELPDLDDEDAAVLLVPDSGPASRSVLRQALETVPAVVGCARPWTQVQVSYRRALLGRRLGLADDRGGPVDTDLFLPEIVLGADPQALADLRARVLEPFESLRPETAARLADTLRSWLLHGGRREEVAAELYVHPQTVRYRMGQVRELYGARLSDPRTVLELTIALGMR